MSGKRGKVVSEAEFMRMWLNPAMTLETIAVALEISIGAVSLRAKVRKFPKRVHRGTKPKIKDVARFAAMWAAGVKRVEIAAAFGVCDDAVSKMARRLGLGARGLRRGCTVAQFENMAGPMQVAA